MRAKLISESFGNQEDHFLDEIQAKLKSNPVYRPYARFKGLINGTLLQLASEISENPTNVDFNFVDKSSYEFGKEIKEEYINDCNDKYCLICNISGNEATMKLEYNAEYAHKLYGNKQIPPIYIVLKAKMDK